jgi:alpha-1,2-glucosyltransferase
VSLVAGTCDIQILRLINVICLSLVGYEAAAVLQILSTRLLGASEKHRKGSVKDNAKTSWYLAHTAMNICLFPPLFFFSGLVYTDVPSVLFVLVSLHLSLLQLSKPSLSWGLALGEIVAGAWALFFRQTNIFWVAVFPLGLAVIEQCLPAVKDWQSLDRFQGSIEGMLTLPVDRR